MIVGDLTGHLARAASSVLSYLDSPDAGGPAEVDGPGYFLSFDRDATSTAPFTVRSQNAPIAKPKVANEQCWNTGDRAWKPCVADWKWLQQIGWWRHWAASRCNSTSI